MDRFSCKRNAFTLCFSFWSFFDTLDMKLFGQMPLLPCVLVSTHRLVFLVLWLKVVEGFRILILKVSNITLSFLIISMVEISRE